MFKYLKSGGLFVIEDLLTSYFGGNKSSVYNCYPYTDTTTLDMLKTLQTTGELISDFITQEEKEYITNNIKEVCIEKANYSEIAFIIKK